MGNQAEEDPTVRPVLRIDQMLCPLCNRPIRRSPYLHGVYSEDFYGEWICNLVTHYRYDHITGWRQYLKKIKYLPRTPNNIIEHDWMKEQFNNKAKRQLVRGISKSKIDLSHKTGLVNACIRVTAEWMKKYRNIWKNDQKEDALKTIDVAQRHYDVLRKKVIGRDDPSRKCHDREWELVYNGNDPKILEKIKREAETEFNAFEDRIKQAKIIESR